MGMDHMNPGAFGKDDNPEDGYIGEDNPFDSNPFMEAKLRGLDGSDAPAEEEDSGDDIAGENKDDNDDDADNVESIIEADMPENADSVKAPPAMILSEPPQSTDDYGYEEGLKKRRTRSRIIIIAITIAVIAAVIALIWSITANPLHLFEQPDADRGGYSEEYRGSQCRIDGQSCSSDDNGNHPSN